MDTKNEDTIVRQIEKNLSNNMNENLFLSGRTYENPKPLTKTSPVFEKIEETKGNETESQEYPLVSNEHLNYSPAISRAEYIRQAREACLRQLSSIQVYNKPYESNYMDSEEQVAEQLNHKRTKLMNLFHSDTEDKNSSQEENTPQELASYRSLIIRCVCAIVLFLSIFLIDKFNFKVGNLTPGMIQEYVTGKDTLQVLENIVVTWLK
jgi:hypothetical protein